MKPYIHSQLSVKRWGGKIENYIDIHNWFDASKEQFPTNAHRALRHHTFGIFEAERIFGITRVNSDGVTYSVRDVGEDHVLQDLGFIPTVSDYLSEMTYQPWMHGNGLPPSQKKKEEKVDMNKIVFDGSQINIPLQPPLVADGSIMRPSIIERSQLVD